MRHLAAVAVSALLLGCAPAVTVRAPVLDLPPIPPKLLEPCEEPTPLKGGTQADLYLKMLEDVGPWGRCIRKDDALIEVIKYRMQVEEKWKAEAAKPTTGWKWPWQ